MAQHRSIRDLDWPLLLVVLTICGLGILQIFSATQGTKFGNLWWRQVLYVIAGLAVFWLATSIDYHTLLGQVPLFYGLSILMLVIVFFFGKAELGGQRWIPLFFGFNLQPSEFVKLVIVLLIARYLTEKKSDQLKWSDLLKLGGLVALPMALVFKQPDAGTALTYTPILAVGVVLAGLRWRQAAAIVVLGALGIWFSYHFILEEFQQKRIDTFLDPESDPKGKAYQVIQSKIAIGSGGMWGRGLTQGSQTQLRFLPVPHTDFIFSTFAEEHGFVGVVFVLGLYFLLLMQIVQNAQTAPDRAGLFICMGVAGLLLFHLLVNVGMVSGRMPIAGIPLPLMSFGGSSTLSVFLMLGLVNNVRLRRFVN